MNQFHIPLVLVAIACLHSPDSVAAEPRNKDATQTLNVLFLGNSYTGRHNLANLVKAMAEAGNPGLKMNVTPIIYGGRTMKDHWQLGSQNFVNVSTVTVEQIEETIVAIEQLKKDNPEYRHAESGMKKQQALKADLESQRKKWDVVVLQSYRDDLSGDDCLYAQYAPRFATLIREQGSRVLLYETTPTTQNAQPLAETPDSKPVEEKAAVIARLAKKCQADVAPMSMIALQCQTERPDLTLRFVNDAHLNKTLAYMTACTIYSVIFDKSPVGLPIDRVTDIRFFNNDDRDKDRDGKPITQIFSDKDRADLQRIAWEGLQRFKKIAKGI